MLAPQLSRPSALNMARLVGLRHHSCVLPWKHQQQFGRVSTSARLLRAPARSYSSAQSQQTLQSPPPPPPTYRKRSVLGRILGFTVIVIGSFVLGVITHPDVLKMGSSILSLPSDEETNSLFVPPDEVSKEINDFINTHPLSLSLRADSKYTESRPHMKYPAELRSHSLTGGTLSGPGRIVVPPFAWNTEDGGSFVSIFYLGSDVCGHPGIVHGGLLATLLDEGLARCCFAALPNKVGVTANLNIDYRSPAPAGSFFVMRAKTTKVEGRKAWVEGWIESLPDDGTEPKKFVEAKALFIEPKNAGRIPLYKAT